MDEKLSESCRKNRPCDINGKGEIRINDEIEQLEKGTFLTAKGEDDFEIPKVAEDMSLLVTISPNPSNEIYSKELG